MKRFLKLSSLLIVIFSSCASPYKNLQPVAHTEIAQQLKPPVFNKALYRCVVDGGYLFKKFHLSGLLLFKTFENGTIRAVFQNEMGYTFFDFEWDKGNFKVDQIIQQLDKPAVIKTLKKDFELLLRIGIKEGADQLYKKKDETYHRFTLEKGYAYYIFKNNKLERIENAGQKNKVITINVSNALDDELPQNIRYIHHKAKFTIELNKIDANANE